MDRSEQQRSLLRILLALFIVSSVNCGLLEMSQIFWTKAVSGGLTKIGKLDPLRVPVIKVDQSEGDTSYRMILRNLEIFGLNESTLESIHIARGKLKSNQTETRYVSYSDLRDVDSIRYRFHTMTKEPNVQDENIETVVSPERQVADINIFSSRYPEDRFGRLQQDQYRPETFEQGRQYDRQVPSARPYAISDNFYRENLGAPSDAYERTSEHFESFKGPAVGVQSAHAQRVRNQENEYQRNSQQGGVDVIDCKGTQNFRFRGNQEEGRQYEQRKNDEAIENIEVAASQTVGIKLKPQNGERIPISYYTEQSSYPDSTAFRNVKLPKNGIKTQSGYIDIIYTDDKINGSIRHFGNLGVEPKENRQVYEVKNIAKDIEETAHFIIYNFTEGEALTKRNDVVKTALRTKQLKDMARYAKDYQEQQGYFEEGMQLIYHFGGIDTRNNTVSPNENLNDTRRTKRAHAEEEIEDNVMHVILRIYVPVLRVRSHYTLTGKVGKEMLRGNGLFDGNFTDVVGDFMVELKKINEEELLMIVRTARAKLSAKDRKINFQDMDEKGPVQAVLNYGLMAAEAVAAMFADDFATKLLSEKTADSMIYRMYKDLSVN